MGIFFSPVDPYFVALTSQAQPVQKTNSLAAVLAFHDKA